MTDTTAKYEVEFAPEPGVQAVPAYPGEGWCPEGYACPDYDETEPLEGNAHEHEEDL